MKTIFNDLLSIRNDIDNNKFPIDYQLKVEKLVELLGMFFSVSCCDDRNVLWEAYSQYLRGKETDAREIAEVCFENYNTVRSALYGFTRHVEKKVLHCELLELVYSYDNDKIDKAIEYVDFAAFPIRLPWLITMPVSLYTDKDLSLDGVKNFLLLNVLTDKRLTDGIVRHIGSGNFHKVFQRLLDSEPNQINRYYRALLEIVKNNILENRKKMLDRIDSIIKLEEDDFK